MFATVRGYVPPIIIPHPYITVHSGIMLPWPLALLVAGLVIAALFGAVWLIVTVSSIMEDRRMSRLGYRPIPRKGRK